MFLLRKYVRHLILKVYAFILSIAICCLYRNNHTTVQVKETCDVPENTTSGEREYSRLHTVGFSEPVDLVVTWVNGSDPSFFESLSRYNKRRNDYRNIGTNRYRDWGTLRYCLRSVEKYAYWIRHVYIVTNGQVPIWLNVRNPRVSIVEHSEIFTNKRHLPSYNSMAIESHIHRIPGLSEQFLYMNDDLFFADKVEPKDFYTNTTGFKIRFGAETVPDCSKKCKLSDLNNGICDTECNTTRCDWDGEDCGVDVSTTRLSGLDRHNSFFGSMMYTVYQYNKAFGYVLRKVPAHTPHIIDKTLMAELQSRFPEGWEKTSANQVRDSYSFQYAFAYYHYLLRPKTCSRRGKGTHPVATSFQNYEDYTYFATGNSASLKKGLQYLLEHRNKKFICINDHIRYRDEAKVAENQAVIDTFFKELLPEPSSFEIET